jgi:NAD(P)-dependent dehydrogenase (short-subunit alcohol dehydrogenase family)
MHGWPTTGGKRRNDDSKDAHTANYDANFTTGIGRATAMAFATEGCGKIAICDRQKEGLAKTKASIDVLTAQSGTKCEVELVQVDVASQQSVAEMVNVVVKKWGRIDYVVNAAGPSYLSPRLPNHLTD